MTAISMGNIWQLITYIYYNYCSSFGLLLVRHD